MTIFQSFILGIIQGLTEYIPVSSSAHLVFAPYLLGWKIPADQAFIFDVLVQMGTLLAVIIYFWKDLVEIVRAFVVSLLRGRPFATPLARLGWYLILATIPAGLAGIAIRKVVAQAFNSPVASALLLLVTAAFLVVAERMGKRCRPFEAITWKDALWIGVAQIISLFPGVSRSGSTIAGGMTRDLERPAAARFAFLMSIPVMLAAGLLEGIDLIKAPFAASFIPVVAVGFLTAAVVGYLSIRWLLSFVARRPLYIFAGYCVVASLVVLIYTYVVL
jgi:undecaprenyl-diphosphatase